MRADAFVSEVRESLAKLPRHPKDKNLILVSRLLDQIAYRGFAPSHNDLIRLKKVFSEEKVEAVDLDRLAHLVESAQCYHFLHKALCDRLAIEDSKGFTEVISEIFHSVKTHDEGKVASYIPQIASVDPHKFGVSICTVDGQQISMGDVSENFSIQSITKTVNYCLALEEFGLDWVHKHVGREPSGRTFNEITVDHRNRPHNPLINAGGIMTSSLIKHSQSPSDRFEHVMKTWKVLSFGGLAPVFNNSVYLSEKSTADRNFALAYFMKEKGGFPKGTNIIEVLDFYLRCCSIEMTCESMSIVAASLARSGMNPFSHEKIFSPETTKSCLSLMYSCGMYDYSGEFAFTVGLPAKSGVGGGLMVVVPNVMGLCIWSPPLDATGNSVRGVEFCKQLVSRLNFHVYDSISSQSTNKLDPRTPRNLMAIESVYRACVAASSNDVKELIRIFALGGDPNMADYDGRTPLHVAVDDRAMDSIRYLVSIGASPKVKDRWGNSPYSQVNGPEKEEMKRLMEDGGADPSELKSTKPKAQRTPTKKVF